MSIANKDVTEKIIEILIEIDSEKYILISDSDYMNLDSFSIVSLIVQLETFYNIEISDELLVDIYELTVDEFSSIICSLINNSSR